MQIIMKVAAMATATQVATPHRLAAAAYCHGFLSSPSSSKGKFLQAHLATQQHTLDLLDLNGPAGPATLSPRSAYAALEEYWRASSEQQQQPLVLIGSSFGGWAAARFAEEHPDRVARLLLLNPGFELDTRWEHIVGGPEELWAWRRNGVRTFQMPATGEDVEVPYSFVEETSREGGTPLLEVPTCIIHGRRDEVVPPELSEAFVMRQQLRGIPSKLVLLDDDHALTAPASLDRIAQEALALCEGRDLPDGDLLTRWAGWQ